MTDAYAPPVVEIVAEEAARALVDDVRTTVAALERELADALAAADEAERSARTAAAVGGSVRALSEELLRMAEGVRSEAVAAAEQLVVDARAQAAGSAGPPNS